MRIPIDQKTTTTTASKVLLLLLLLEPVMLCTVPRNYKVEFTNGCLNLLNKCIQSTLECG
jgi:hypothetical protein